MKVLSNESHEKWNKLSEEKKKRITSEAICFGFSDTDPEEIDLTPLHVIAYYYESEREHKQFLDVLYEMQELIINMAEVFKSDVFNDSVRKLRHMSSRLEELLDKATD